MELFKIKRDIPIYELRQTDDLYFVGNLHCRRILPHYQRFELLRRILPAVP